MRELWFRFLVFWYRLRGATPTQAEWKAREAQKAPERARAQAQQRAQRSRDPRYQCACGQLLSGEDTRCHACGRRQWMPPVVRRWMRLLGLSQPSASRASTLALVSMIVGFVLQIFVSGTGVLMGKMAPLELLELGAYTRLIPFDVQPWRALSYTWVHGGVMHLGFNAFALWQIGPAVEHWVGSARFLLTWVLAGVAGVVGPPLLGFESASFVVGASGSIFGLIGLALMLGHQAGTPQGRLLRDAMVKWVIYATVFGFLLGGVAHSAHFGGLAAGLAVALLLSPAKQPILQRQLTPVIGLFAGAIFAASVGAFALWQVQGALPPKALAEPIRAEWLMLRGARDGLAAVLPPPAVALAEEATALRRRDASPEEVERWLAGKLFSALAELDEAQRQVLMGHVRAELRQAIRAGQSAKERSGVAREEVSPP